MTENNERWEQTLDKVKEMKREIAAVIVNQEAVVEEMLIGLLCRGHCLLVGVPGLAKTLLVSTLGKVLGLSFNRIQFTPDLMPADILGSEILQQTSDSKRAFEFTPGPVFTNLILADEINRTPPKTQSALLEAMQERQVTVAGKTRALPLPFLVYATQNPIEHEGTYPLPEAQLDRFFFNITIDYPNWDDEREILQRTTRGAVQEAKHVMDIEDVIGLQELTPEVPLPDHVMDAALRLTQCSRPQSEHADDYVKTYVEWGGGPRASQTLVMASKALALLRGQPAASIEELRDVALPTLRHRIIPNYNATGEGVTSENIINHLLETALK